MAQQINTLAARRLIEEVWNRGELETADDIFAQDCSHDVPVAPDTGHGPEAHKELVRLIRSALEDFQVEVDEITEEIDSVVFRWTATGRHRGSLMGIPPSGRFVKFSATTILTVADGLITDHRWQWDPLDLMRQLSANL